VSAQLCYAELSHLVSTISGDPTFSHLSGLIAEDPGGGDGHHDDGDDDEHDRCLRRELFSPPRTVLVRRDLPSGYGLEIYALLCLGSAIVTLCSLLSFTLAGVRAARVRHTHN
jgi:hypothetical protein